MMSRLLALTALGASLLWAAPNADARINVVTTDYTLAYIARAVGGDLVRVESLARGTDDPHLVDPRPSMVLKLARAEVFVRIGLDQDLWADSVLARSGNARIQRSARGYVDASRGVRVLEVPAGRLNPAMGHIHVYGNPHYLNDPGNGIIAAGNIAAGLIRVDPRNQPHYHQRFVAFGEQIRQNMERWRAQLAPFRGAPIAAFHRSWAYFAERFGFREVAHLEPRPGAPPSPGHIAEVIRTMREQRVRVLLTENYRARRWPDFVERETGARAVFIPGAVEGEPGIDSYVELIDTIVSRVAAALRT
ncbi:MAG TPA: metal ABC transporter substrate-binding protein [Chthonomonadales bacterium]|nr:metal ABC transporter substrate-binding protein [Chthonomonadales bacterium]